MVELIKITPKQEAINYRKFYNSKQDKTCFESFDRLFTNYIPRLLEIAVQLGLDEKTTRILNHVDYIDFHYRRYLSGFVKTPHRTYSEIRQFLKHYTSYKAVLMIFTVMVGLYRDLISNELYEVIVMQNKLNSKIFNLIKKEFPQINEKLFVSLHPDEMEKLFRNKNLNS